MNAKQPNKLLNLVGNTPLVELTHISPSADIRIFAKLEGQNPSGSIKDRVVQAIVNKAERQGDLSPGDTIVEASSGNTAIALAMVGKQKGYNVNVVIPEGVAPSIGDILNVMGVEITWCTSSSGLKGAIDEAKERARVRERHYYLGQFVDQINVETHYSTTGREIAQALPTVTTFVAGIGTGGTISGVGKRLKEDIPGVQIVGVEPQMGERLQGLRSLTEGFVPALLDLDILDRRFLVDSASALRATRKIFETEGVMVGVSSGAALHAALRVADKMTEGDIVVMCADAAWKYLPAKPWDAADEGSAALDERYWW